MSGSVKYRIKAKYADGREQTFKQHNGETRVDVRRDVATVFADDQGRTNVSFNPEFLAAIKAVLGAGEADRVFFDLFEQTARNGSPRPAARASRTDAADDDGFDF